MKRPSLNTIWLGSTALVLAGLCAFALIPRTAAPEPPIAPTPLAVAPDGSFELQQRQAEELTVKPTPTLTPIPVPTPTASPTPTPTPTPMPAPLPDGAVEIWSDQKPILALATKDEAETMLNTYLERSCIETDTERTLFAALDCELLIVDATGDVPLVSMDEAVEQLLQAPALVPVKLETERREVQTAPMPAVQSAEDSAIAHGCRVVSQLGTAARAVTTTLLTYRGGEVVTGSDPVTEMLIESRPTLVRTGVYVAKSPFDQPGRGEGAKGRDAEGLRFSHPIRGVRIDSYFGTRAGVMHNGVDYTAKEGTPLLAPEEGIIIYCAERGDYGFVIDIDHGNGFVSRLTHCADVQVELNQRVFRGDAVASLAPLADKTAGRPHLHYELLIDGIPMNPTQYLP